MATFGDELALLPGQRQHRQRRREITIKAKLAAAVLTALFVTAVPAQAFAAVRLVKVQYDSPGSDTRSNSSLNAEYAVIKNTGNKAKTLTGWTLRDTSNHVYQFGTYKLRAGYTVTIHTGKGSNTARHRYWGSGAYVWNNTGDTATLKNRAGSVIDRCSWSGGATSTSC